MRPFEVLAAKRSMLEAFNIATMHGLEKETACISR